MKTRNTAVQTNLLVLSIITLVFLQVQSERSFGFGMRARGHVNHVSMHVSSNYGGNYGYGDYWDPSYNTPRKEEGAKAALNPQGTSTSKLGYDDTTGPNRNSPYALLDELPPPDADVQSHKPTNRGPSLDPGAAKTSVSAARAAARAASMKNPKTAALFKGDAAARQTKALARIAAAVVAPAAGRLDDKTAVRQRRHECNTDWAATARAGIGVNPGSLFNKAWWRKNKNTFAGSPWYYYPNQSAADWWGAATWSGLIKGLGGNSSSKAFTYNYGDNVAYAGDVIYVNGQQVCSYEDYVATGRALAVTATPAADASVNWMPLGTFAMSQSPGQTKTTMTLQLVVDKEGNISGTYYNIATKDTQIVQGGVDLKTQRVAFTIGKDKTTCLETGMANLTENYSQVWVHFPDKHSQIWLISRLKP